MNVSNPILSFAEHLRARRDLRVELCRVVESVFREVGLSWSEIAIVRTRDRARYAFMVTLPEGSLMPPKLNAYAAQAACIAWERLRLRISDQDFYWRVQATSARRVTRTRTTRRGGDHVVA